MYTPTFSIKCGNKIINLRKKYKTKDKKIHELQNKVKQLQNKVKQLQKLVKIKTYSQDVSQDKLQTSRSSQNTKSNKIKEKSRIKNTTKILNNNIDKKKSMELFKFTEIYKQKIIDTFKQNVKGKKFDSNNLKHNGKEGHWLEGLMGIQINNDNNPDLLGYEQKKYSKKITFGDWCASAYLFSDINKKTQFNMNLNNIDRSDFIKIFGSPNPKKNNRYSWSGKCFPKYGKKWNECGQRMLFDDNNNLIIQYSFENDTRQCKETYPDFIKKHTPTTIAFWENEKLQNHFCKKFNQNGFYILKKNKDHIYDKICFGNPITYDYFKKGLINGTIYLDSGMYNDDEDKIKKNTRPYSNFRSNYNFWEQLITEEY